MNIAGLLLIICATASGDCVFSGTAPENTATFRMKDASGREDWAAVRLGREWAASVADITEFRGRVELHFDTPWSPREPFLENASRQTFVYESPAVRKDRLTQGWERAGYTFEETPQGCWPVLKSEVALAARAREMAQAPVAETAAAAEDALAVSETAPPAAPGFLAQWGVHLAVLAVGAVLLAVVIKGLILSG